MTNNDYTVDDLVANDSFLAFVFNTDSQAVRYWQQWIKNHPEKSVQIEEATLLVRSLALKPILVSEATINQEVEKLESSLSESNIYPLYPPAFKKRPVWQHKWLSVAASFLLLLGGALAIWLYSRPSTEMVALTTKAGSPTMLLLPDSTLVFLSGNSTIRYYNSLQAQTVRKVWLQGEAFFHVKSRPVIGGSKFQVHTGQAVVEVIGTRFNVLNRNNKTNVILTAGKVNFKVKEGLKEKQVALVPGDMISVTKDSLSPKLKRVNVKQFPVLKEEKIFLEDTSIRKVAFLLQEQFGVKVRLQHSAIADLKVSGSFPLNNEKVFLKTLAVILNLQVEKGSNQEVVFRYK